MFHRNTDDVMHWAEEGEKAATLGRPKVAPHGLSLNEQIAWLEGFEIVRP